MRNRSEFLGQLLAYGASEVATRLSRLGVVVAVARSMDAAEIGLAAAALATGDLLKALTENGVGQRIIAAPADQLAAVCNRAHRINWLWCAGLCIVQSLLALLLWVATGNTALALLILVLAGEYLFMPAGLVQCGLALRAGRLKRTASIAGGQAVLANLLSLVLALVWPSALALVLPRLLTAPFWLISMRALHPWQRAPQAGLAPLAGFVAFGWPVLATEIVKAARMQADKLLVAVLMGAEMLGLYFMAFNAGLSLATSFSTAFAAVLFPHLCASTQRGSALRQGVFVSLLLIAPVVGLQSVLAPWYVPLLLGPDWQELARPISILCLVAIPTMLWTASAGWMRAENRTILELRGTTILTAALLLNTFLALPYGLTVFAWGYLATACVVMTALSGPVLNATFFPSRLKA
ncbi:oligosaccharide flippase family protein [Tropicibacter oceani]|uniref:Oligosaccharide flippase family protein n=1 Tax=Tropicibacter oceani TaxID=3058420 RepID=A0ABY8QDW9_9RHOB|nr:oligosaccharide flippase family protein [Tropicibacter oceani]WGW02402.1 oligosaccharide flippase family protein [Tropicibacter oceani]